jgi:predicted nucleic acid-binding Zn ribbon protein
MTAYIVCRMCGRYIPAGNVINRAYCSDECTRAYSACSNCGKVFPKGKGFDGEYCTRECTIRYQILRKYGPEPVTVVAEV